MHSGASVKPFVMIRKVFFVFFFVKTGTSSSAILSQTKPNVFNKIECEWPFYTGSTLILIPVTLDVYICYNKYENCKRKLIEIGYNDCVWIISDELRPAFQTAMILLYAEDTANANRRSASE